MKKQETEKYNALVLSLHPKWYDMMNDKTKKYELRTYDFKSLNYPARIFIYVSKKTKHVFSGMIAASFIMYGPGRAIGFDMLTYHDMYSELDDLLEQSGLSLFQMKEICNGKDARFIKVNEFKNLFNPVSPSSIDVKPPQGITYLTDEQVKRIDELARIPF
ncbi:MAG: hypothetical protein AB7E61_06340 [Acholeplasmataceae bacterium]